MNSSRVASAYLQRTASDAVVQDVLGQIVESWTDAIFDTLGHTHIDEKDIEEALLSVGITADRVNEAVPDIGKEASSISTIHALGGMISSSVWHMVVGPFHKMWQLATSARARAETKAWLNRVLARERTETQAMWDVARRVANKEVVSKGETKKAVHQFADLVKTALVAGFLTHTFGHLLIYAPGELAAMLMSPADEIATILLDIPLLYATEHLLGQAFGLLPTAFYEVS